MKHSTTVYVTLGIANEDVEVEIDYTMSPHIQEQGPSYASGGQPAEGGEIEIQSATILIPTWDKKIERQDAPLWLLTMFQADDHILDALREAVE